MRIQNRMQNECEEGTERRDVKILRKRRRQTAPLCSVLSFFCPSSVLLLSAFFRSFFFPSILLLRAQDPPSIHAEYRGTKDTHKYKVQVHGLCARNAPKRGAHKVQSLLSQSGDQKRERRKMEGRPTAERGTCWAAGVAQ